jgi:uncharacterized iron-regulated membrane protein
MKPSIRQGLLKLHLIGGFTAGLVLIVIACAGALMVFRPQLDPVVNPELFAVQPGDARASLDTLAANAQAAYPQLKFNFIRFWADPARPAMIRATNSDQVYLDPWNGRVLGVQNRYRGFFGRAEDIHRFLGMGTTVGKQIAGAAVLIFVFLIVSGFILWLPPAWRAVRGALTVNPALKGRAKLLNWHRVIGAWIGAIVFVSALSGLPHAYEWYEHGVYRITGTPVPQIPPIAEPAGGTPLPMEELWRRTQQLMPDWDSAQVNFPRPGLATENWVVETGSPHPHARSYLHLDTFTGETVKFEPWANSSPGHRLYYWLLALHLGQAAGWPGQLLLFLAVLGVPVLAVTGVGSYLARRSRNRGDLSPQ